MRTAATLIFALSSILCCGLIYSAERALRQDPVMRVSIADDVDSVSIYLKRSYSIKAAGSGAVLMDGPCIAAKVSATKGGIAVRDRDLGVADIKIDTEPDSRSYVDKRLFRGSLEIIRKDNGKLTVINHIDLDEYLYGVLYHEVSHKWPMEALKAQAIVARTFALYEARQNRNKPYDLRSDIYSQVYGGSDSERWSTTTAVKVTKGKVLTYKGDIFPAYYHATCSGGTEDSSELWNIDIPPLDGVACDYCRDSKYYCWKNDIPIGTVGEQLRAGGYKIGGISSVEVVSKNASGRVDKVEVKDTDGNTLVLSGKDFRQALGPNDLRSAKFEASVESGMLVIDGKGWGHGVGMCQWGAYGQAKLGKRAEEILKYYYPGAEIGSIESLKR